MLQIIKRTNLDIKPFSLISEMFKFYILEESDINKYSINIKSCNYYNYSKDDIKSIKQNVKENGADSINYVVVDSQIMHLAIIQDDELLLFNPEFLSILFEKQSRLFESSNILDKLNIAVWKFNIKNGASFINYKYANLLGLSETEKQTFGYDDFIKLVHPEDKLQVIEAFNSFLNGETSTYSSVTRIKNKNGKYYWFESNGNFLSHKNKEEVIGTMISQNELINSQQSLLYRYHIEALVSKSVASLININPKNKNEILNSILKNIGKTTDVDRVYIFEYNYLKNNMSNTYEWVAAGISKQIDNLQNIPMDSFSDFINKLMKNPPILYNSLDDIPDTESELKESLKSQNIKSLLIFDLSKENNHYGFIGFDSVKKEKNWDKHDILLLKSLSVAVSNALFSLKLLEELTEEKEKALESSRLKSAFLANISHEIRTPLNGILGFAQLINQIKDDPKLSREYSEMIQESGTRMLNIINDILEISKLESSDLAITKQDTDLNNIFKEIYNEFVSLAEINNIDFKLSLPEDRYLFSTDKTKLYQIINNLLSNAFKFTKSGRITFGYKIEVNKLIVFVEDTGIGIDKKYFESIFNRFYQVEDYLTRSHEGAGIGLNIVKVYTEKLGGEIKVESELNKGSRFTCIFSENTEDTIQVKENNYPNILIFEDDITSYKLIYNILDSYDINLFHAKDGNAGLDLLEELIESDKDVSLILMDLKMPNISGFEATNFIKDKWADYKIPIVCVSAYVDNEKDIAEISCDDYLKKPYNISELLKVIQKHVNLDLFKDRG